MTHYVIAHQKGHLELVEAESVPVAEWSELKKIEKVKVQSGFNYSTGDYTWKTIEKPHVFKVLSFSPSTTVAHFSATQFRKLTGHQLDPGVVWPISTSTAELLLKKLGSL